MQDRKKPKAGQFREKMSGSGIFGSTGSRRRKWNLNEKRVGEGIFDDDLSSSSDSDSEADFEEDFEVEGLSINELFEARMSAHKMKDNQTMKLIDNTIEEMDKKNTLQNAIDEAARSADKREIFQVYDTIKAQSVSKNIEKLWMQAITSRLMNLYSPEELKKLLSDKRHAKHHDILDVVLEKKTRSMYTSEPNMQLNTKPEEVDYYPGIKKPTPTQNMNKKDKRRSQSVRLQDLRKLAGDHRTSSFLIQSTRDLHAHQSKEKEDEKSELSPRVKDVKNRFENLFATSVVQTRKGSQIRKGNTSAHKSFFEEKVLAQSPRHDKEKEPAPTPRKHGKNG